MQFIQIDNEMLYMTGGSQPSLLSKESGNFK